jgi:glutamyl-tRNA synthetase
LRIEDIDSPRVKPGAAQAAMDDLRWLGLDWDDTPIVQTTRLAHYEAALERLKAQELVYPCTCTRTDVERAASAPHPEHEGPIYPGTCSARCVGDADALKDKSFSWRLRANAQTITFDDGFHGSITQNLHEIGGDFVVWKSAGTPAYQLAVVVDDAAQAVTEVIRGDDLIPSTPRQMALYQAIGSTPPSFTHVPLVVGPDGRRLAKRHGDTRLSTLRAAGVRAEALVGLLAWSCGWLDRVEPIPARDLLHQFNLVAIPRQPFALSDTALLTIGFRA